MITREVSYKGRILQVMVDDQDAHLLDRNKWHVANCGVSHNMEKFYLRHTGPRPRMANIYLHREIMGPLAPGQVVDHLDGNGLNCLRNNLRVTTQPENARRQNKKRRTCK